METKNLDALSNSLNEKLNGESTSKPKGYTLDNVSDVLAIVRDILLIVLFLVTILLLIGLTSFIASIPGLLENMLKSLPLIGANF
ncbi:MAG: hypothetical protein Q7S92_06635 [Candidatus Diapherotrites archaeon]|nr:hypothetical protein [Candidatus Diapherotrites archaeon]